MEGVGGGEGGVFGTGGTIVVDPDSGQQTPIKLQQMIIRFYQFIKHVARRVLLNHYSFPIGQA